MKGFTLVELLVVIVIIGVLSAIALPQYKQTVEKARVTEAVTVSKALQDAIQRHLQEFPDDIPTERKQIMDVQLTNGKWIERGGKVACFSTKYFTYSIDNESTDGGYIGVHRRDGGPFDSCEGITSSGDMYYFQLFKVMDGKTEKVRNFDGKGKYNYLKGYIKQ